MFRFPPSDRFHRLKVAASRLSVVILLAGLLCAESRADLKDAGGHVEEEIAWVPGRMIADPNLNLVYVLDETNKRVLAYDTVTGFLHSFVLGSTTLTEASLDFSLDGSEIYISTPNSFARSFAAFKTNTLAQTIEPRSGFDTFSFIVGSDGYFYMVQSGELRKLDVYQNVINARLNSPTFREPNMMVRSDDGSRFFVMETGVSSGNGNGGVTELTVQAGLGADPLLVGYPFDTCNFSRDFSFDQVRNLLFRASAGESGISIWDLGTDTQSTADAGEFFAVEQLDSAPHFYGSTGDANSRASVRRIRKSDELPEWEYQISGPGSGFPDGIPIEERLAITPNGHIFYAKAIEDPGQGVNGVRYHLGLIRPGNNTGRLARSTGLTATDGDHLDRVTVSWRETGLATDYVVYRGTDPDPDNATEIATVSATTYDDMTAAPGESYFYWVKGSGGGFTSDFSDGDEGVRLEVIPDAPTGVTATDGNFAIKVELTWAAAARARSYTVYRTTVDSPIGATFLGTTTDLFWEDRPPLALSNYYYWVSATNTSGESVVSASNSGFRSDAVPSTPTGVTATDGTDFDRILVNWDADPEALFYSVLRNTLDNVGSATLLTLTDQTSVIDDGVTPGTTYYYWVRAGNQNGEAPTSPAETGFRGLLSAPAGLAASDDTFTDGVNVSWDPVVGADRYEVWRSPDANIANASLRAVVTTLTYLDSGATMGDSYYYWVKATRISPNPSQESAFTGPDIGRRGWGDPGPVSGIAVTDGTLVNKVRVDWNANPNAQSYKIYRGEGTIPSLFTLLASGVVGTSWEDTAAIPGQIRRYWVRCTNPAGDSSHFSGTNGFAKAETPPAVTATDGTLVSVVRVTWTPALRVDQYQIYRATNPGGPFEIVAAVNGAASYDDTDAFPGITYHYRVQSWPGTPGSESDPSPAESGLAGLPAITGLTATDGSLQAEVALTWEASVGATVYEVFRGTNADGSDAVMIGTTPGTSFTDSGATPGQAYFYFVKSKSGTHLSALSTGDAGHGTVDPPFQPDGTIGKTLAAQIGDGVYSPAGIGQSRSRISKKLKKITFHGTVENDGETADELTIRGNRGNSLFRVLYFDDSGNVTAAAVAGLDAGVFPPGATKAIRISVKPSRKLLKRRTRKIKRKTFTAILTATSKADETKSDRVKAITRTK